MTFVDCLYFSATTQTAVGCGDIVPATVLGRVCTMIQAAFRYFCLAFMVSLLVARVRRPERRQNPSTGTRNTNVKMLRLR